MPSGIAAGPQQSDAIGLGLFQVDRACVETVVANAISLGYRHFDTASVYGNEAELGRAISAGAVPREDLFVTTKLGSLGRSYEHVARSFEGSLTALGCGYVDRYLIHLPVVRNRTYIDTWRSMTRLQREFPIRAIGVSNFDAGQLEDLIRETGVTPAVNQVEVHPFHQQHELHRWHGAHGIRTEAWSPLARGACLQTPVVRDIARQRGCTPAQAVLAWHRRRGIATVPKSVDVERQRENLASLAVELDDEDDARMSELDGAAERAH